MATAPFSAQTTDTKSTDYAGNMIYENGTMKRVLVDGGYIETSIYHYYLTDHLCNNRIVANASGTVIQKNHYYPFGTAFAEGTTQEQGKQPYKYNGKELDQMHGLNLYDYSARYYESAIGRFTTVDPLVEKYYSISPYAYCLNNPLKYIDPDGRKIVPTGTDEFVAKVNVTIAYMKEKGTYEMVLGKIDALDQNVRVMESNIDGFGTVFVEGQNTIYWDPRRGFESANDVKLSPATLLNHEGDHALQANTNSSQYKKDTDPKTGNDKQYGQKEERRVITGVEQETAKKHGEIKDGQVTRTDHESGKTYKTQNSTTTKPLEDEKYKK
jgi:RHS repeat-associated protein